MSTERRRRDGRRLLLLAAPFAWLALFLLAPNLILGAISLSTAQDAMPPYAPLLVRGRGVLPALHLHPETYAALVADPLFALALGRSALLAGATALLCLALGLPMAHAIARAAPRRRLALTALVVLPFWTSFLIRIYAWIGILRADGPVARLLAALGLAAHAPSLLDNDGAVLLGMVYAYLPFMVLPIVAVLERQDRTLVDAALDLGATPFAAFRRVTLPLARPGIVAGLLLVFVPALGEYVIPDMLGGGRTLMIAGTLWGAFFSDGDWPTAAALAIVLLVAVVVPIGALERSRARTVGARP